MVCLGESAYKPIYDMLSVRIVTRICALSSNKIHYFVFTFTGNAGIGYNYLQLIKLSYATKKLKLTVYLHSSNRDLCSSSAPPNTSKTVQADP